MEKKKTYLYIYVCMAALLFVGAAISLSVGSAEIGIIGSIKLALSGIPGIGQFVDISAYSTMQRYIILQVRLPRVLLAALGATIAILFGVQVSVLGIGTIGVCAFIGAILTIMLVYLIGGMKKGAKTIGILLTGTAISTLFSAVMSLLMSLNHDKIEQVYLWTMGSFSSAVWVKVCYVAICEMICLCVCIVLSKDLNLMAMGEETAQSLGIETARIRRILILVVSVMVAACVSVSGVIGFVGLVIPHIVRFLLGDDYRRILPGAILGGGFFLMICDTLARTVTAPGELPVGVLTAIVGAPYLILLIKRKLA